MPEVGVLNLEIRDNSSEAGKGLSKLAGALLSVKQALGGDGGIGLSPLVKDITDFSNEIKGAIPAIKILNDFGKSMSALSKVKSFSLKAADFESLKNAVSGFNIGNIGSQLNQLRLAVAGKWGEEGSNKATDSINSIATAASNLSSNNAAGVISDVAKAINEYASAVKNASDTFGTKDMMAQTFGVSQQDMASIGNNTGTDYANAGMDSAEGLEIGMEQGRAGVVGAAIDLAVAALEAIKSELGIASPSKVFRQIGEFVGEGFIEGIRSKIPGARKAMEDMTSTSGSMTESWMGGSAFDDFENIPSTVDRMTDSSTQFDDAMSNMSSTVDGVSDDFDDFTATVQNMSDTFEQNEIEDPYWFEDLATGIEDGVERIEDALDSSDLEDGNWLDELEEEKDAAQGAAGGFNDAVDEIEQARQRFEEEWMSAADGENPLEGAMGSLSDSADEASGSLVQYGQEVQESSETTMTFKEFLNEAKDAAKEFGSSLVQSVHDVGGLKGALEKMFPTISGLLKRFQSVAKMRALRYIVKQISAGVSEGLENMYWYSKSVGTDFAPAMDSAASSLLQFKNSIGAAVSPLLSALIPALQTVISWLIEGINYINQFFALLNGQSTWTKAVMTETDAYKDNTKSAKAASKAAKDLLADWDELNIIQSENGGGGGGGSNKPQTDYASMFEEVGEYNETIRDLVDFIRDNTDKIWSIIKKIGVALLGWKVSSAFTGAIADLGALVAAGAIIALVFDVTTMLDNKYLETGDIGYVLTDVLTTALGAFLASKVVGKVMGAGAGKVAAGVTLVVSAVADIIALANKPDVSALSEEGIIMTIKSALKLGAGFALFGSAAGLPLVSSIKFAAGAALIGIAVSFGVKAVAEAANTGEITTEAIKDSVAAAIAAGLGVTVFAMLGGATVGAALAIGAAAALVIGAGIVVTLAVVAEMNKDNVTWGTIHLTDEQVQEFVDTKMFTVNIKAAIEIMDSSLTALKNSKSDVESKITTALGTMEVIKLGLAKDEDYTQLGKEILGDAMDGSGGLIGSVSKYIDDAKALGKLTLQFTPTLVGDTTEDISGWYTNYTTGWDTVNNFFKSKGEEIGKLLTTEEGRAIVQSTPEVLAALMDQVTEVTNAITGAQITSEAFADLNFEIGNLEDLDENSMDRVFTAYISYLDKLREKEKQLVTQQYTSQGQLVAGLIAMGANPNEEPLKSALEDYNRMGENINQAIEDGVNKAAAPGREMISDYFSRIFHVNTADINMNSGSMISTMVNSLGIALRNEEEDAEIDTQVNRILDSILEQTLGKNYGYAKRAVENGIMTYADFFDDDVLDPILANFNSDEYRDRIKQAYIRLLNPDISASELQLRSKFMNLTKDEIAGIMEDLGRGGNVDMLNRPIVQNLDGSISTLITETLTASADGSEGMQWNQDVVLNATLVTPDGEVLDENTLDSYIEGLLGKSANIDELFWNDRVENGGRGLLINAIEGFSTFEEGLTKAKEIAEQLHVLQDLYYSDQKPEVPELDTTALDRSCDHVKASFSGMTNFMKQSIKDIDGLGFSFDLSNGESLTGNMNVRIPVATAATGAVVKSGDLVMANENGNFEMMGRMGSQPVIANNQQIVNGISQGVATANSGVENRLNTIENLLTRLLNKEFVARAVPSSGWGRNNAQSNAAWDKVTG
jgi:methyl-accepting chemotaxis protein